MRKPLLRPVGRLAAAAGGGRHSIFRANLQGNASRSFSRNQTGAWLDPDCMRTLIGGTWNDLSLAPCVPPSPPKASPPAPPRILTPLPKVAPSAERTTPQRRLMPRPFRVIPAPSVELRRIETVSIDAELDDDSRDLPAAAQPLETKPIVAQAKPVPGRPPRFRRAASAAHDARTARPGAVESKTGAGRVLLLSASLLGALFLGAGLLTVETTLKAPGALRAPNGVRSVASVLSGAVTDVLLHAGDDVTAGQVVVRLEEMQLRASLTLREQELATLRQDTLAAARADEALIAEATFAMQEQQAALERRRGIHRAQLNQRAERLGSSRHLLQEGGPSAVDLLSAVQAAAESLAVVGSEAAELALGMADRRRQWQQRELDRSTTLERAVAAVEEARSLLAMTEIRSPASGRVESLLVNPGNLVQAGTVLAQIVPKDVPRAIVAFLPSREAASITIGSQANVEVESLRELEFGKARAEVTRISTDLAKPEEILSAFGAALAGSFVRVELTLLEHGARTTQAAYVSSGERVTVRLHRGEQPVLGLVFEFVSKWWGERVASSVTS